jgi:type III secretion protein R
MLKDIHPSHLVFWSFVLPLLPILVGTLTASLKVSLVFGMLRNAFGVQGVPGKMAEFALSIGITMFVMAPVFKETCALPQWERLSKNESAINLEEMVELSEPWRKFLVRNTGARELAFVNKLRERSHNDKKEPEIENQANKKDSLDVMVPGFVLSELNNGFKMGFSILLPFLVLDLIVANILMGIGLSMVSPTLMAFPLKVLLFLAVDGWMLITKGLIISYL